MLKSLQKAGGDENPARGALLNGLVRGCLNRSRAVRGSTVKRIGYRISFPYLKKRKFLFELQCEVAPRFQSSSMKQLICFHGGLFCLEKKIDKFRGVTVTDETGGRNR